jgi:hypothetical protein
MVGATRT